MLRYFNFESNFKLQSCLAWWCRARARGLMALWIRYLFCIQEIRSWNPPVVTGICDLNESQARHHCRRNLSCDRKRGLLTYFLYFLALLTNIPFTLFLKFFIAINTIINHFKNVFSKLLTKFLIFSLLTVIWVGWHERSYTYVVSENIFFSRKIFLILLISANYRYEKGVRDFSFCKIKDYYWWKHKFYRLCFPECGFQINLNWQWIGNMTMKR